MSFVFYFMAIFFCVRYCFILFYIQLRKCRSCGTVFFQLLYITFVFFIVVQINITIEILDKFLAPYHCNIIDSTFINNFIYYIREYKHTSVPHKSIIFKRSFLENFTWIYTTRIHSCKISRVHSLKNARFMCGSVGFLYNKLRVLRL